MLTAMKVVIKQQGSIMFQPSSVCKYFLRAKCCDLHLKLFAIEKMAAQGLGSNKITEALGSSLKFH